jgi:hypothetical protein
MRPSLNDGLANRCINLSANSPNLVEYPGIEPGVPLKTADLQSTASPLMLLLQNLAERVRFELTEDFHLRRFSRPVQSTALSSLHIKVH